HGAQQPQRSQGEKSRRHPKDTIRRLWIHQLFRVRRQQRRRVHNKVTRQQRAKAAGYVAPSPFDASSNWKGRKKLTKQVVRTSRGSVNRSTASSPSVVTRSL